MRVSRSLFTVLLVAALVASVAAERPRAQAVPGAVAKDARGSIRGTVRDQSDGVLPGVTVSAATPEGRPLETTVTDASGDFTFDQLAPGTVVLMFHLDGFEDAKATVAISPGSAAAPLLVQKLGLPAHSESVVVLGDPPAPPPPPRPVLAAVPDHDPAAVCGPAEADGPVPSFGRIRSRQDERTQGLFAAGDELLIDGGSQSGLEIGQNFIVRRRYQTTLTTKKSVIVEGEHSSGLLQIVSVEPQSSTAVIVYSCDEMVAGDYLAPFTPDPVRATDPVGLPAFDNAARILFADAGQMVGAPRRMMVIDRGTAHGLQPGQRLTLFRRSRFSGAKPAIVGEAVIVAARKLSATVRVEQATDVIFFGDGGDFAAPQRPAERAQK
jgi:hypothetical protein